VTFNTRSPPIAAKRNRNRKLPSLSEWVRPRQEWLLENHKGGVMGILEVLGILVSFKEQTITVAASFLDGAPTCARWYLMKRTKFATADVP
jgi:hypothetical protein